MYIKLNCDNYIQDPNWLVPLSIKIKINPVTLTTLTQGVD